MNDEQFGLWSLLALVREPESKSYKTMFYCLVRRTADQLYSVYQCTFYRTFNGRVDRDFVYPQAKTVFRFFDFAAIFDSLFSSSMQRH